MSRLVARAETWERTYEAFQNINFAAFDYDTVKRSLLDYIKLYFPESFNDFIETSEFVAVIESFAYIVELLAYRLDVNAHENFISTAQRRDSILRLAKLVSYSAARPLPARGLVKLQSVMTSESVLDTNGVDLANRAVRWNDVSNTNWKDQFILVLNRAMEQQFGSVGPSDRFQLQDVLFELYSWNLVPLNTGVFSYSANVSGQSVPMELVPAAYDSSNGIVERRPANSANFTFMYGQDGLGDSSATTGFFCFTKQGSLQRFRNKFDGVTPNQTYDIGAANVNETDIWLNQIDPITGATLDQPSEVMYRRAASDGKTGEWIQVDLAHAQNVIFNTNPKRNKYEVETRDENRARLVFGDGEFADIPAGTFDIWARTSVDQDIVIPQSAISGASSSFTYLDAFGRTQTFTFTYSLVSSLQNASAAEDTEHVRVTAPAVYYSQDRMVNGEDHNSFMLQDASILKLRAINRTFAGESKYITWHDASGTYENVKIFGDDGAIYFKTRQDVFPTPVVSADVLINSYMQPLLSTPELYLNIIGVGVSVVDYRRSFNVDETARIAMKLTDGNMAPITVYMYYNTKTFDWWPIKSSDSPTTLPGWNDGDYIEIVLMTIEQTSISETSYNVIRTTRQMVVFSETTSFWNTNDGSTVIDYNTLNSDSDELILLQANPNYNRNGILTENVKFNVLNMETVESGPDVGLPDISRISVAPVDLNGDGVPDNVSIEPYLNPTGIAEVVMPKVPYDVSGVTLPIPGPVNDGMRLTLPIYYVVDPSQIGTTTDGVSVFNTNDIRVYGGTSSTSTNYLLKPNYDWSTASSSTAMDGIYDAIRTPCTAYDNLFIESYLAVGQYQEGDTVLFISEGVPPLGIIPEKRYKVGTVVTTSPVQRFKVVDIDSGVAIDIGGGVNNLGSGQLYVVLSSKADAITAPTTAAAGAYVTNQVVLLTNGNRTSYTNTIPPVTNVLVKVKEYVYFSRETKRDAWVPSPSTPETMSSFISDVNAFLVPDPSSASGYRPLTIAEADARSNPAYEETRTWTRYEGRGGLNFAWFHHSPRYHLVDPSPTNIIDTFLITKGYYNSVKRWLEDPMAVKPTPPTPFDLRTSYGYMLNNKMISDVVVLNPGKFKLLFGAKAPAPLRMTFKVVRSADRTLTDNQIKTKIVTTVRNFFNITLWEFGETFYFTELAAAIHAALPTEISSVIPVPTYAKNQFGDLFEVQAREDEILYPDISVNNIEIVTGYTPTNMRMNG